MAELVARIPANDPVNSAVVLVILGATGLQSDATLIDYDTLAAILAAANDEIDNTGYTRQTLTNADLSVFNPDDAADVMEVELPSVSFGVLDADGTKGDPAKIVVCYDEDTTGGSDTNLTPLTAHDITFTPDGVTPLVTVAGVFFSAEMAP